MPVAGEIAVAPAFVGLCGTDLHIVAGTHPRAAFPLVLGHEIVGVARSGRYAGQPVVVDPTISCGSCTACARGLGHVCQSLRLIGIDRPGGLATLVHVAESRLHPVPPSLPLRTAALAEPLAVAVHAAGRAGPYLGSHVTVFGAGPVGLLTGLVVRAAGAAVVEIAEPSPARRSAAAELGFAVTPSPGADVVFDAAGVPGAVREAIRLTRPGGTVVIVGVHSEPAAVDLRAVTFAELTLTGTRVYRPADIDLALTLLETLDVSPLVSDVVPLDEAAAAFGRLARGESLKVLVQP
jgi:(R,R)-butanediol dehydrogenase / meso-butanediol dehydrogenase / diacetyl reductase